MYNVNLNIENLSELNEIIQATIIEILKKVWERISKNYFIELIKSMNDQINAVKHAKKNDIHITKKFENLKKSSLLTIL